MTCGHLVGDPLVKCPEAGMGTGKELVPLLPVSNFETSEVFSMLNLACSMPVPLVARSMYPTVWTFLILDS